jgi:CheY-like chemotaxis protein/HPt (histidine-containing phosphotransfer) domain-containing protein
LQVAVDQGARESRGARAAASSPSSLSGRILVVEDDPINATVADGYLRELGCSCVWVTDGPSAFSRVGAEPFDLIFMDLNMPGIDGFAATAALRQRMAGQKRIPIIALTAHDAGAYREKCLAADMDDILSKPYTLEECAAIVRRWLPQGGAAATEDVQPAPPSLESLAEIDAATVASIANLESPRQRDLYGRLVGLFEQSTAQRLEELGTALAANDLAAGAAICHKLKSAAANVGALAYSGVVRQAESECLAGHVAQASTLHRSLTLALPLLLARLRDQQMKVSA